jgi:hypothetical protein
MRDRKNERQINRETRNRDTEKQRDIKIIIQADT